MARLLFGSDIMYQIKQLMVYKTNVGDAFNGKLRYENYLFCDDPVGNLETPIACEPFGYTVDRYRCTTSLLYAKTLIKAGLVLASTANNCGINRGTESNFAAADNMDSIKPDQIGTYKSMLARHKSFMKEIDGITAGYLAYT